MRSTKQLKIIAYLGPSGSKLYRAEMPFKYLNRRSDFECIISPNDIQEEELMWADIIFIQGLIDPKQIAMLWAYKMERGKIIVADRDDVIDIQNDNPFKPSHDRYHAPSWTKELLKICNGVIVTTQEIATEVKKLNSNVKILPNCLDMDLWDKSLVKNDTDMVRIGFNGSITHRKDIEMVAPAIKKVLKDNLKTKFIICGDILLMKYFEGVKPNQIEFVDGTTNFYKWSDKALSLALDIGIAPLVDNHFNRGRSFLKFLEYSMMGCAGVYSMPAYKDIVKQGELGFICSTQEEWEKYLNLLISNLTLRKTIGRRARKYVRQNYDIAKWVRKWADFFYSL